MAGNTAWPSLLLVCSVAHTCLSITGNETLPDGIQRLRRLSNMSSHMARILRERTEAGGLDKLLVAITTPLAGDLNCLAILTDPLYQDVFTYPFFKKIRSLPYYKVLVEENEELSEWDFNGGPVLNQVKHDGCDAYIMLAANGEQLAKLLTFGERERRLSSRALLLLLHDDRLLARPLLGLWRKLVDVVFLRRYGGARRDTWFELSTVPFPATARFPLVLRRLDTWKRGRLHSGRDLFRDKAANLRGQPLVAATFDNVPAALHSDAGFTGLEVEVLGALSQSMNFAVELYVPAGWQEEKWGTQRADGSVNGLLGQLQQGRAALALGSFHYTPHHLRFIDLSVPYTTHCLTFLTPEMLTDNSWMTLVLPFKSLMWMSVLVSLAAGAAALQWVGGGRVGALSAVGALLLVPASQPPGRRQWRARLVLACWWLQCLLVAVAYRASLTAILANPAPRVTIDTMEQLAASAIAVGGWSEQQREFFETALDGASQRVGTRFQLVRDAEHAVRRVASGQFALYDNVHALRHASVRYQVSPPPYLYSLALTPWCWQSGMNGSQLDGHRLHVMQDCAVHMPVAIGLERNSPLKPRIDRQVRRCVEAGLVEKWLADTMQATRAAESRTSRPASTRALVGLRKLLGAGVALAAGCAVAALALAAERALWRRRPQTRRQRYPLGIYYSRNRPRNRPQPNTRFEGPCCAALLHPAHSCNREECAVRAPPRRSETRTVFQLERAHGLKME
ncbi:uncharacterized protein LOC124803415 [Schistocerca piceifrons]|uniref:uncharacterized protein LOC124803415 n=1 Tax=Schistocerca piceifrons TaxID=274613 RepID=UPI001F5FEC94|nr:uncharacterized protein LOC124803415 [Schistocerca piceifrons]